MFKCKKKKTENQKTLRNQMNKKQKRKTKKAWRHGIHLDVKY